MHNQRTSGFGARHAIDKNPSLPSTLDALQAADMKYNVVLPQACLNAVHEAPLSFAWCITSIPHPTRNHVNNVYGGHERADR